MKTWMKWNSSFFICTLSIILALGTDPQYAPAQTEKITIIIKNYSGELAFVKLIGPTIQAIEIPQVQHRTVNALQGKYYFLVRYGSDSDKHTYFCSDSITVGKSVLKDSVVTIILYKDFGSGYSIRKISRDEFERVPVDTLQISTQGSDEAQKRLATDTVAVLTREFSTAVSEIDSTSNVRSQEADFRKVSVLLDSQRVAQTKQILQEALSVARACKDRTERVQSLLTVAPLLEKFGLEEATGAIEETVTLVPKLPEMSSLWKPKNLLFRDPDVTLSESYRQKAELTFQLVQLLAYKSPPRALELALSLKDYYARALGIEMSLQLWPRTETEVAISKIRDLANNSQKEKIYSSDLVALASGAMFHDIGLARDLANRVIKTMSLKKDAYSKKVYRVVLSGGGIIISITALWTYEKACEVLAIADLEEAKRFLLKLKASPTENTANLIAFARGVIHVNAELAWQALLAIDNEHKDVLVFKAELLRLIVHSLPTHLKAEAQQYILKFLSSLPAPYEFKKMTFSFTDNIRDEFKRLAVLSDAIVSLGSIGPEMALEQIQRIGFSEFLDNKFILETKTIFELLETKVSGLYSDNKEARKEFANSFFQNLVKLDLALSLLNQNPQFSLGILDSLKNDFWIGLSYTALREGFQSVAGFDSESEPNPEGIKDRLRNLLRSTKEQWPVAVINDFEIQSEKLSTKQERLIKVAELLDKVAVAVYKSREDAREVWLDYLPFALAHAGKAIYANDSTVAIKVFQTSRALAKELPTPAYEWTLCWNTVVFSKLDFSESSIFKKEASKLIVALTNHKPWEEAVTLLINQVAVFNPGVALNIARQGKNNLDRVQALVAVVNGMNQ